MSESVLSASITPTCVLSSAFSKLFVIQVVYASTIFREARSRRFFKGFEFTPVDQKEELKMNQKVIASINLGFEVFSKRRKEKFRT